MTAEGDDPPDENGHFGHSTHTIFHYLLRYFSRLHRTNFLRFRSDRRTVDPSRRLHRHGRTVSLATAFYEHNPMLCDMARRANERMVLDATDSNRLVRDHVCQDQRGTGGSTTHHSHTGTHTHRAPTHYWRCLSFVQDCKGADDFLRAD